MDIDYIKEKLYNQLAIDYCCQVSDIKDDKNHFTEYKKLEGRRKFEVCGGLRWLNKIYTIMKYFFLDIRK